MQQATADDLARYRALIVATLPQFSRGHFTVPGNGWDSVALECDNWIFKFPRSRRAEERLRREAKLLAYLKPRITMTLPQMVLHEGDTPFTQHLKIPGASLVRDDYLRLRPSQRDALALRMAQLYVELHALPLGRLQQVGAVPVDPWMSPVEILEGALPRLPRGHKGVARQTVAAYRRLRIVGDELVFGYFDGHGWNMAFDHRTGLLNGVFDFADCGFGARHRDLSSSNWIAADLTLRIIDHYEELARRPVDRKLVMLYTSALRLAELAAGLLDEDVAVANVVGWQAELAEVANRL